MKMQKHRDDGCLLIVSLLIENQRNDHDPFGLAELFQRLLLKTVLVNGGPEICNRNTSL